MSTPAPTRGHFSGGDVSESSASCCGIDADIADMSQGETSRRCGFFARRLRENAVQLHLCDAQALPQQGLSREGFR